MDNTIKIEDIDLDVKKLGIARFESPLSSSISLSVTKEHFIEKGDRIHYTIRVSEDGTPLQKKSFERAGPRAKIYFKPQTTRAAIVTCGGLCPGLNDVIRGIVMELYQWYDVDDVWGVRYGFSGLAANPEHPPIKLDPEVVSEIHKLGGTILGSSRGHPDVKEMVKTLVKRGINILFCIGGDGTLRGASAIAEEINKQKLDISVIGIPKTIDNDINFVYQSFGFQSAVSIASGVIDCAHVEAVGAKYGVGLVKLMGRDAGFIASYAVRASGNADYCLIPEMDFKLEGKDNLYENLRNYLLRKEHAVIVVAEGAGQHLIGNSGKTDASGNKQFNDIGRFIRFNMQEYFKEKWDMPVSIKYISPSYVIRSVKANSEDSIFCADLARFAVDAGMAGKTDMMIGHWHGEFTNVPLKAVEGLKKRVRRESRLWLSVLAGTGQPPEWW
jgi:6-phosphofructokinase 1